MGHLAKLWTEVSFFFLPELSQKAKKIVRDGKRERGGGRGRWKEGRGEGSEWKGTGGGGEKAGWGERQAEEKGAGGGD